MIAKNTLIKSFFVELFLKLFSLVVIFLQRVVFDFIRPFVPKIYHFIGKIPDIGRSVRVFANGPGDLGSIPGGVIPKNQKMVLDAS